MKRNKREYESFGKFTYGTDVEIVPKNIAEKLKQEFNLTAEHCRYHVDGAWYMSPEGFPYILFDRFGYLYINNILEYTIIRNKYDIHKCLEPALLHINEGIHTLPGYAKYLHEPESFKGLLTVSDVKKTDFEEAKLKNEKFLKLKAIALKSLKHE